MRKAWAFYRRSTEMQEVSVEDQRRVCHAKAAQIGVEIVREFVPAKGYASGLTIDRDETFLEMIRLAESRVHGVQYLLVYDVSRFGRLPPKEKFYWEQHLKRAGIQIIYAAEHFQNDGSLGDELHQFVSHSEAYQYSVRLSQSTTRGCITHAKMGHSCGGAPPFGYDRLLVNGDGAPVKVLRKGEHKADKLQRVVWVPASPDKVEVVRRIFSEYARGRGGLKKIARDLNDSGSPSPRCGRWTPHQILSILRNPVYIGTRVYNKHDWRTFRKGEGRRIRDPKEWIKAENAHEAIVDKETFEAVQTKLGPQTWGRGRPWGRPWLLSGLLYCSHCNHRFNGYHKTSKVHGQARSEDYYNCSGYVGKGTAVCRSFHVLKSELEEFVLREIQGRLKSPALRDDLKSSLRELARLEFDSRPESDETALKKEIKKVEEEMGNLLDAIKGGLKWGRVQDEIRQLEEKQRRLEAELSEARSRRLATKDLDEIVEGMLGYLDEFGRLMQSGTVEEKKAVFRTFVHRIVLDREQRKATAYFYTVPVVPQLATIPYPRGVVAAVQAPPRRAWVMTQATPTPQPQKEIAEGPVGASGDSFSNIGCGGWI